MAASLRWFERLLHAVIAFAFQHPKRVITAFLLVALAFAAGLPRARQVVSIADQLDPRMQSTRDLLAADQLFGGKSSFGFLAMAPVDGWFAGGLCALKRAVKTLKERHPAITDDMSVFSLRRAQMKDDKLHYPALLPDVCMLPANSRVSLEFLRSSPWAQLLTGPKLQDLAFNFTLAPLETAGRFGTFDPSVVEKLLRETPELVPLTLKFTGTSTQEYFTMVGLQEAQWMNLLVVVIILLLFRLIFGSWQAGPVYFVTVGVAATVVYGGMSWSGDPVDPLSVCLFLLLSVSSLEDYVFISYEFMKRPTEWQKSFQRVALPCFFTSVSAAAAFISLSLASDLSTIQRFGKWAAIGAMTEWCALFLMVPAFIGLFPRWRGWVLPHQARFREAPLRWVKKAPPRFLSVAAMAVFLGAYYSVTHFRLSQSPAEMFPAEHPFQQTLEYIKHDRGWLADASLVYGRATSAEKKQEVRRALATDPVVLTREGWDTLVDYVAPAGASALTRSMVERELGITRLSRRYLAPGGEERDVVYLKTLDIEEINHFRARVSELCPNRECWPAGEFIGFADFSRSLIHTLFESLLGSVFSVGLIVALLGLGTGNLRHVPGLVLASFWGPAVMLTMIFLCDISINFVTCIVASTLIGLTGDNAIMFMFQGNIKKGIEEQGIGSFQTALSMTLCSLVFVLSYFEPPRMLGVLLAGGFLCALLGDVWLLRGLLPAEED